MSRPKFMNYHLNIWFFLGTIKMNTTTSTYTEAHKKSYEKRRVSELLRMREYYLENAERLKLNRRTRYALKKERERASAISI